MKYYVAYGSNLNKAQMAVRCPNAYPVSSAILRNVELVFRSNAKGCGVATIEHKNGGKVPVGIWAISDSDELALDLYEGYPYLYIKKVIEVVIGGKKVDAMIYLMTYGHSVTTPSDGYFRTILTGYKDFGFDADGLYKAAGREHR